MRILVTNSSASLCLAAKIVLEEAGYDVLWATDAKDALDIALQGRLDAIVLDMALPDLDVAAFQALAKELNAKMVALHDFTGAPLPLEEDITQISRSCWSHLLRSFTWSPSLSLNALYRQGGPVAGGASS